VNEVMEWWRWEARQIGRTTMGGTPDWISGDKKRAGSERQRWAGSARGQRQGHTGRGCVSQRRCGGARSDRLGCVRGRLVGWVGSLGPGDGLLVHHPS
jgi:hypothetical protein